MLKAKTLAIALILTTTLLFLGGCASNQSTETTTTGQTTETTGQASEIKLYRGMGQTANFRVGPGQDENGGQIYSINYVTCTALFDEEGRIVDSYFDVLEIFSPNDTEHVQAGAPKFSGYPGQPGYLNAPANTEESAMKEVADWKTKRERGDEAYGMNWSEQMNFYQEFFKGKTVAEIEEWFAKYTSDKNGRPLKPDSKEPEDQEKYAKLTEEEKKALAEVTSGATMSLRDPHGDLLGALKEAYENRQEITIPVK